jgi:hypothetical protein
MAYLLDSGLAISLNDTPTTATRASGGSSGSTSVVITAANNNISYDQTITGTGFAANTRVTSVSGTTVNFSPAATGNITGTITFSTTWQKLTDHNREPISISQELIESQARMANGRMRKYVVTQKSTISVSWNYVPSFNFKRNSSNGLFLTGDENQLTADGNVSAAWLESFYQNNSKLPIYLKLISSEYTTDTALGALPSGTIATAQTGSKTYNVFMNNFSKTIINRTQISDYVNMSIDFTEI